MAKTPKPIPFEWVLDHLEAANPRVQRMFSFYGVYVGNKIVLTLGEDKDPANSGVCVATYKEHHASLRALLPNLKSIKAYGPEETQWQILNPDDPDFEEAVVKVCELIVNRDPRVGRIPKRKAAPKRAVARKNTSKPRSKSKARR